MTIGKQIDSHFDNLLDKQLDEFDREQEYLEKLDDSIISEVNAMKEEIYEAIYTNLKTPEQRERLTKEFYVKDIEIGRK